MGVEPTKSRLATLSGFEGQPPHRERFPSARDNGGSAELCHRRTPVAAGNLRRSPGVNPPVNSPRRRRCTPPSPRSPIAVAFASLVLAAGTAAAQEMRKDQVQDRVQDTNQRSIRISRGQHQPRPGARAEAGEPRDRPRDAARRAHRRHPVARRAAQHQPAGKRAEPADQPRIRASRSDGLRIAARTGRASGAPSAASRRGGW